MNKKENIKKLFKWDGFKKELPWILFWIAIFFLAWSYMEDKKICNDYIERPCEYCLNFSKELEYNDPMPKFPELKGNISNYSYG